MASSLSAPKFYHAGTLTYTKGALVALFFWLLWGDFCYFMMECVVPGIVPLRFQALGASNLVIGLAMGSIPAAVNLVLNPVISFQSDRYRSRWGRRIPFIFFSAPLLVLSLFLLAFSPGLGPWLHTHFSALLGRFSPAEVTIALMAFVLTLFNIFNAFVNSVFWYLFNDVVPEHLLARFMSLFRMVSLGSTSLYSLFIFPYADTHFTEIFVGIGLFYLFGFGLMCLKVKEGEYPPPPAYVDGRSGPFSALKTFAQESMTIRHYWYLFLANMGIVCYYLAQVFTVFFHKSMGLTLSEIGELNFWIALSGSVTIVISGWLADRYHPIRIVIAGLILQICFSPLGLIYLFWHPSPHIYFCVAMALNVGLGAPVAALINVIDPPLFMRIFPRDRYGQFCSANAMCRSVATIIAGPVLGEYLDVLTRFYGANAAYCLLSLWVFVATGLVLFAMLKLYGSWQRHGGDTAYVPPMISPTGLSLSPNLPNLSPPGS